MLPCRIRSHSASARDPVATIRALLESENVEADFTDAKLIVDSLIDPETDVASIRAELGRAVTVIGQMLSTLPPKEASSNIAKLKALKAFLYRGGRWNNGVAYQYDSDDPLGQNPSHALLAHYLIPVAFMSDRCEPIF